MTDERGGQHRPGARAYNLGVYADLGRGGGGARSMRWAAITDELPRLRLLGRLATNRLYAGDLEGALTATAGAGYRRRPNSMPGAATRPRSRLRASAGAMRWSLIGHAFALPFVHRRALNSSQRPEVQLIGAVFGHAAAGRFAEAEIDAITSQDACLTVGDKEGHATGLFMSAWVLIERGQLGRAASLFVDAASVNREINDPPGLRWCLAGISLTAAMSGHADRATSAAAEFADMPAGPMTLYEDDLIERSKAWVSACTGDLPRAREILKAAADHAGAAKLRITEARLLHDIARLGRPDQAAPRLAELAGQVEGNWVPALARHAAALASSDSVATEESGRALDALGASLLAAEAYTAAAAGYRSAGQARPASAAARRAAELIAACGDITTPALAAGHGAERLTKREREIAELAAAGVASREIAERLFLSIRTVDNHLQSAYDQARRDQPRGTRLRRRVRLARPRRPALRRPAPRRPALRRPAPPRPPTTARIRRRSRTGRRAGHSLPAFGGPPAGRPAGSLPVPGPSSGAGRPGARPNSRISVAAAWLDSSHRPLHDVRQAHHNPAEAWHRPTVARPDRADRGGPGSSSRRKPASPGDRRHQLGASPALHGPAGLGAEVLKFTVQGMPPLKGAAG